MARTIPTVNAEAASVFFLCSTLKHSQIGMT